MDNFALFLAQKGFTQKSVQATLNQTRAFLRWCTAENLSETSIDYNKMLLFIEHEQQRGLTNQTIQQYLQSIKQYYKHLIALGATDKNPILTLKLLGTPKQKRYPILSFEDLQQLYHTCPLPKDQLKASRNKALLGLILFQGIRTVQLHQMTIHDIRVRTAKIHAAGSIKTNDRWLTLEPEQWLDLITYRMDDRPQLLKQYQRKTDLLFFTLHSTSDTLHNLKHQLLLDLKKVNRRVESFHQLRTSLITHWLKTGNLRQAQYRAGHRFVSSTEKYRGNDLDQLKNELDQFFPEL